MKRIVLFLVTLLCLSACGSKQQQSGKETLTVTLEPLRYFTEVIAGDKYNVVSMVPKGSSPETYDPTPQQLVNLDKSTAYLRIGYIGFVLKYNPPYPELALHFTMRNYLWGKKDWIIQLGLLE